MSDPIVSIGMPVYNGAAYLRRAVQSILAQDYEDFDLIISNNASTDETESTCRELAERDGRIRYFRNDANLGASRNYNKVFRLATGQFFKWAVHDAMVDPDQRHASRWEKAGRMGWLENCFVPGSICFLQPQHHEIAVAGESFFHRSLKTPRPVVSPTAADAR